MRLRRLSLLALAAAILSPLCATSAAPAITGVGPLGGGPSISRMARLPAGGIQAVETTDGLGLVLFAPREEANAAASNLRTYWRELGFQVMPDQYFAPPLFLHCLPFGADRDAIRHMMRYRTLAASHATALLPVFGDWKGTGEPVLNLVGRNGQLMDVNLFDSLTNYNAVVAASSGSGKSFLANDLETGLQSYAVGEHFEQFIRKQVEAGRYASASASEIVREALRLLETQDGCARLSLMNTARRP